MNAPSAAPAPPLSPAPAHHSGIAKNASVLMGLTMVSRVAGLVRDFAITHFFGASGVTDVFYMAFTIPNVLRRLVAEGTLTAVVQPAYQRVRTTQGDEAARRLYASVLGFLLIAVAIFLVLGVVFASPLVFAFARGFGSNPEKFALCVTLTRWLFPGIVAMSLVGLSMAVLNAHEVYAVPALAPIVLNISMIAGTVWGAQTLPADQRIFGVVVGVLLGSVMQVLVQQPALLRRGLVVRPRLVLDEDVRGVLRGFLPGLFGLAVYQLNVIVLRQFASSLGDGAVSYYYTADRLMELAVGVFAVAIAQGAFSTMNRHASEGNVVALIGTWRYAMVLTSLVAIPAALGLAALAEPIVSVLFLHGAFGWADVQKTAATTIAFAPGLIAISGTRATAQVFYALKDTKTPVIVSGFVFLSNLLLGYVLRPWGVVGLACALSISSYLQTGLLIVWMSRRLKRDGHIQAQGLGFLSLLKPMLAQTLVSIAAVAAAYGVAQFGVWSDGFSLRNALVLGVALCIAVASYGVVAIALGLEGVGEVKAKLLRRFNRSNPRASA